MDEPCGIAQPEPHSDAGRPLHGPLAPLRITPRTVSALQEILL
jgi:hypothetical protein